MNSSDRYREILAAVRESVEVGDTMVRARAGTIVLYNWKLDINFIAEEVDGVLVLVIVTMVRNKPFSLGLAKDRKKRKQAEMRLFKRAEA